MCLQVNSLDALNNEYRKAILGLDECLKVAGIAFNAL
jgi:hypothetical protein